MPLDFRYHLASLAAVFGALLIGILLGVAMREGPVLSNQVEELRAHFNRAEALQNIDQRTDQFNQRTQRQLVANRLSGRAVALVINPAHHPEETIEALRKTLREAGASITFEVTIKASPQQMNTAQLTELYQRMGISAAGPSIKTSDLMYRLGMNIGADSPVLAAFKRERIIRVNGDASKPVSAIIYLGGAEEEQYVKDFDQPFLSGCVEQAVTVVATEPLASSPSVIRDYQKVVPTTIDNVDRAAGRIALVLALSSGQHGHFGYKDSASDVTPEIE